ncbi:MAG: hypothetical protein HQ539_03370 [Parcubacteria group bacterium]|nr:hypothetical protein [Parcubacteria group bacterium]
MIKAPQLNSKFFQYILLAFVFYLLAALESSFFIHFSIYSAELNLVFISVFLLSFFTQSSGSSNVVSNIWAGSPMVSSTVLRAGIIGGLLLDLISIAPFGAFTITFLLVVLLIRKIQSFFDKSNISCFLIVFLISFLFFKICFSVLVMLLLLIFEQRFFFNSPFNWVLFIEILYNLFVVLLIFCIAKLK